MLGAAASGADLIVARAARPEGVPVRLVLPHDSDTFRRTSVTSRGARWEQRYDRLLEEADLEADNADPNSKGVYKAHNRRLLDRANELRETGQNVWALVIAPANLDPTSVTADFAARAAERHLLVLDIDPLKTKEQRQRVFIAMPYGKKFDPDTRRNIDCDTVFDKVYVPALEDRDLEWERADLQTDSGIIHAGMIDSLASADLVLADLSTGNANVAYELGLRHAFAAYATVITKPVVPMSRRAQIPFDVAMIRTLASTEPLMSLPTTRRRRASAGSATLLIK